MLTQQKALELVESALIGNRDYYAAQGIAKAFTQTGHPFGNTLIQAVHRWINEDADTPMPCVTRISVHMKDVIFMRIADRHYAERRHPWIRTTDPALDEDDLPF